MPLLVLAPFGALVNQPPLGLRNVVSKSPTVHFHVRPGFAHRWQSSIPLSARNALFYCKSTAPASFNPLAVVTNCRTGDAGTAIDDVEDATQDHSRSGPRRGIVKYWVATEGATPCGGLAGAFWCRSYFSIGAVEIST